VPISDLQIKSATPGTTLWDSALRGFGVRVGKQSKTFIVLIGSGRRKRLGRYPIISLAEARAEAKRILAEKTLGKVHPTHVAFDDAKSAFIDDCKSRVRPLTVKLYERHLTVHFPFRRKSLADIGPADIIQRLKGLKPSEKSHAFRIARTFFGWCVSQNLIDTSPMARMEPPGHDKARDRILTDEELKAVYNAAYRAHNAFQRLVCLLIHTGCRRGELTRLEWSFIAPAAITFPPELTKNGRTHTIPMGPRTKAILHSIPRQHDLYVFPSSREHVRGKPSTVMTGYSTAKRAFDEACGVHGWTLHDLRRTFATGLQKLGVRLEVIEALLNHVSGSRSGIVGVYQRHSWQPEMRDAIELWEQYLYGLLAK